MTPATVLRLEAEQLADAVILVDDVVAGAEVGERLQRPAAEAALARRAAAEDLVVGQQHEPELAPDEAAAGRRRRRTGARARSGSGVARLEHAAPSTRRRRFCVRSASPRCGKATTTRWPERRSAASSLSASASPRAAIAGRCASKRERLALRERVELGRAGERGRLEDAVLLPDAAHVVRAGRRGRAAASRAGTRSSGTAADGRLLPFVRK